MPIFTTAMRCLLEVVDCGSIRGAADTLNLAPSAINRHIKNLEAEYRVSFLDRLPRGVRATPAGGMLIARFRQWQAEAQTLSEDIARLRVQGRNQITIGAMECFAGSFMGEILQRVRRQHPGSSVHVVVGGTRDLLRKLEDGDIDLVVAFNVRPSSEYWALKTFSVPLGVVTPPAHKFASQTKVAPTECRTENLLMVDDSLTLRSILETVFPNTVTAVDAILTSNSIVSIKGAVSAGVGIGVLTCFDVRDEVKEGRLALKRFVSPGFNETLAVCVRDQASISPVCSMFARELVAAIDQELALPFFQSPEGEE